MTRKKVTKRKSKKKVIKKGKSMKKIIVSFVAVLFVVSAFILAGCHDNKKNQNGIQEISNKEAIVEKKKRTITIVNNTDEVINELVIYVNSGTNLYSWENPDEHSLSYEISEEYDDYDEFSVALTNNYDEKYLVEKYKIKEEGNTEIVIDKDDLVPESSSKWTRVQKWFNGDK